MSKPTAFDQFPGIYDSAEFLAEFKKPNYIVRKLLQHGYLYSFTSATGLGKTSIALSLAAHIGAGRDIGEIEVRQGNVLFMAGENPTDVQMRWAALLRHMRLKPEQVPVSFVMGAHHVAKNVHHVVDWSTKQPGGVSLVIVDTFAAHFRGESENDNVDVGEFGRTMREIINKAAGNPAVLVCCHPSKMSGNKASRGSPDANVPRGGSAFLAEVDGNFYTVKHRDDPDVRELGWTGKFRGPTFDPISFRLLSVDGPMVDDKDEPLPTLIATPITGAEVAAMVKQTNKDEERLASLLPTMPGASYRQLAKELQWDHSKARRTMKRLADRGVVTLEADGSWKWLGQAGAGT